MLDSLLSFILAFGHFPTYTAIIVLGAIFIDRKIFASLALIMMCSIIVNAGLKVTFKVPLPPELGSDWYGLPSGHMQTALVFYGWLAMEMRNRVFSILLALLMPLLGVAIVHFGYHYPIDILAAMPVAVGLLWLARKLQSWPLERLLNCLVVAGILIVSYTYYQYPKIMNHNCLSLLGIMLMRGVYGVMSSLALELRPKLQ